MATAQQRAAGVLFPPVPPVLRDQRARLNVSWTFTHRVYTNRQETGAALRPTALTTFTHHREERLQQHTGGDDDITFVGEGRQEEQQPHGGGNRRRADGLVFTTREAAKHASSYC